VVEGNLVTSRTWMDLPFLCEVLKDSEGREEKCGCVSRTSGFLYT